MPGTVLLDSEGRSKLHRKDRAVVALVQAASEGGIHAAAFPDRRLRRRIG